MSDRNIPAEPMLRDLLTAFGQAYHKLLTFGAAYAAEVEAAEAAIISRAAHETAAPLTLGKLVLDTARGDVKERTLSPSEAESFHKALARSPRRVDETPAEPSPCEHLRSELLAEKRDSGEPIFEMRKCLDCTKIFRVRSSLKANGDV
jgi:hypothetical protein